MTQVRCRCGKDMQATASICKDCRITLECAARNIADYHRDLETIRTGQTRYSHGGSSRGHGEHKLGMDTRFDKTGKGTRIAAATRNTLTTWARYILEHTTRGTGPACLDCIHRTCKQIRRSRPPADTVASMCDFLVRYSDWLRVCPVGDECLADLLATERALRSLVDRPVDRWYAGVCNGFTWNDDRTELVRCTRELHAEPGQTVVKCRCGAQYDVEARRKALLAEAEDREATVRMIARIVTTLGDADVSEAKIESRINVWVHRGRLKSHGARVVDGVPRKVYRIGDVFDLLAADTRSKAG